MGHVFRNVLKTMGLSISALMLSITAFAPLAYAAPNPDACFTFNSVSGTITAYNFAGAGCGPNVEIPSQIGGAPVTVIADSSFRNRQIETLIIPNSVITIHNSAFQTNKLASVVIPNSVTSIGTSSFASNWLTSITISSSLTTLPRSAFFNNQLTSVTIPDNITSIGDYAFSANQLEDVTIGQFVTSIGYEAFSMNKLVAVTVPDSVITIDQTSFVVQNPNGGTDYNAFWNWDATTGAILDTVWYTQLITESVSNPNGLTDSALNETTYPESAGSDMTADGDTTDVVGGHLINAAQSTVTYEDGGGTALSPTVIITGTGLSTYLATDNSTNDLSLYHRVGSQQTFTAPQVAGYSTITPSSPYTAALAGANTEVNFVYSNASTPAPTTPSDPTAPSSVDATNGSLSETGQSMLTVILVAVSMIVVTSMTYWVRVRRNT